MGRRAMRTFLVTFVAGMVLVGGCGSNAPQDFSQPGEDSGTSQQDDSGGTACPGCLPGQDGAVAGDSSTDAGAGITSDSGASSDGAAQGEQLELVSGNGEVVLSGWPGTDPLLVRATNNGQPVPNETITWTTSGPLHASSNQTTSVTDASGLTSITVVGEQFTATTSWVDCTVTATSQGGRSVQFVVVNAYPGPAVGNPALAPLVQITSPASIDLGHQKSGSVLSGGIQALVVAQIGPDDSKGIPQVGIRLADTQDWTQPAAGISCAGGTALSDATGLASCDVQIGTAPGSVGFQVVVGGFNLHGMTVEIDP
jgi:hypothetical protein